MKKLVIDAFDALPRRMKEAILHLGFNIARDEFNRFAFRYALAPEMFQGLAGAAHRGLQPSTIIDIGAYRGEWSRRVREIWPGAHITMIEPNAEKEPEVYNTAEELDAVLIPALLGREDGATVEFSVMGTGSSVLPEWSPVQREVERRTLRALDCVLDGEQLETPVLMKLDAQGYELEILGGAPTTLARTEYVVMEVSLIEINAGAPLAAEVVAFMARHGFAICEILEIHRRPLDEAMNQVDILFARESSPLFADKRHWAE